MSTNGHGLHWHSKGRNALDAKGQPHICKPRNLDNVRTTKACPSTHLIIDEAVCHCTDGWTIHSVYARKQLRLGHAPPIHKQLTAN